MARTKSYTIDNHASKRQKPHWTSMPGAKQITLLRTDDIEVHMPFIRVDGPRLHVAYKQDRAWHEIQVTRNRVQEIA